MDVNYLLFDRTTAEKYIIIGNRESLFEYNEENYLFFAIKRFLQSIWQLEPKRFFFCETKASNKHHELIHQGM